MAEDTRLAEACLLLNYSHESYKYSEQMLTKRASSNHEAEASLQQFESRPLNLDQTLECSEVISLESVLSNLETTVVDEQPPGRSNQEVDPDWESNGIYSNSVDVDPISSLLAAVNCALPRSKTKPTILQRTSKNNIIVKPTSNVASISILDHNYCQQPPANGITVPRIKFSGENQHDPLHESGNSTDQAGSSKQDQITSAMTGSKQRSKRLKLVAVHLGASNSSRHKDELLNFSKQICESVMLGIQADHSSPQFGRQKKAQDDLVHDKKEDLKGDFNELLSAESAVVQLIKFMEDNRLLNCGYGSNLNMKGQVECDASLMSDKTQTWVGVGAVSGCKNPILLAKCLYDHQTKSRPVGLIQPNLLVGSGAKSWMQEHCSHLSIADSKLITAKALSNYQTYKANYDDAKSRVNSNAQELKLDTVGAIAVDSENNFASAISSGGLLLKHKGRVGQGAIPGAGCWSENSVAVTTTGVGEYLTLNMFAKKFYDKLSVLRLLNDLGHVTEKEDFSDLINDRIEECFEDLMSTPALAHVAPDERLAGMLSVSTLEPNDTSNSNNDLYLSYAHNTKSMCVGFMTCNDTAAHSLMSLKNDDKRVGPIVRTMKISPE